MYIVGKYSEQLVCFFRWWYSVIEQAENIVKKSMFSKVIFFQGWSMPGLCGKELTNYQMTNI